MAPFRLPVVVIFTKESFDASKWIFCVIEPTLLPKAPKPANCKGTVTMLPVIAVALPRVAVWALFVFASTAPSVQVTVNGNGGVPAETEQLGRKCKGLSVTP